MKTIIKIKSQRELENMISSCVSIEDDNYNSLMHTIKKASSCVLGLTPVHLCDRIDNMIGFHLPFRYNLPFISIFRERYKIYGYIFREKDGKYLVCIYDCKKPNFSIMRYKLYRCDNTDDIINVLTTNKFIENIEKYVNIGKKSWLLFKNHKITEQASIKNISDETVKKLYDLFGCHKNDSTRCVNKIGHKAEFDGRSVQSTSIYECEDEKYIIIIKYDLCALCGSWDALVEFVNRFQHLIFTDKEIGINVSTLI